MLSSEWQPSLKNTLISLQPLQKEDVETLYKIACDPLIWEQHPNKDRYQRNVFEIFFKGAMESGGAFLVSDTQSGKPIGSSRFYDLDNDKKSIAIGYTFLARTHWGTTYNRALKTLMLDYAFQYIENVIFHVGAQNTRSQKAMEKLGAKKIGEEAVAYYGEPTKLNFVYCIAKKDWTQRTV